MNAWSSRSVGRRAGALVALTVAGAAWFGAAPGRAAPRVAQPNLKVTEGFMTVTGASGYRLAITRTGTTEFNWRQRTKNVGAATHKHSRTAFQVVIDKKHVLTPADAHVRMPLLGHNESFGTEGTFQIPWDATWDYGRYETRICADAFRKITESHERDNCHRTHEIYVVPEGFVGTVTGTSTDPTIGNVHLDWTATVHFQRDDHYGGASPNSGTMIYPLIDSTPGVGDVAYSVSGTDNAGCSWHGSGTYQPAGRGHFLRVSFLPRGGSYDGAGIPGGFHFTATTTCGSQTGSVEVYPGAWDNEGFWFNTGGEGNAHFQNRLTTLRGHYALHETAWAWDLKPTDAAA